MNFTGKIPKIWILLCLFISTIFYPLNAEIVQVEGESKANITAYVTKRFFSYPGTKNLVYHMYLPRNMEHSLTTQNIKRLRRYITPFPTEINEYQDEYGNKYLDLIWKKQVRNVQVDLQFEALLYSRYYPYTSEAVYPIQVYTENMGIYLKSTELTPANDPAIKELAESISKNRDREIDVVFGIFRWVDENIALIEKRKLKNSDNHVDAAFILKRKMGTEEGIVNLIVSLLRAAHIPSRVVYGISFQKEITIKTGKINYIFDFPNSTRYWVEVYFPDTGWIGYDPRGLYFCTTPNLIALSVGPDTNYVSDRWSAGGDEVSFESEYIFDIKNYSSALKYRALTGEITRKIILSPQIPELPADYKITLSENSGNLESNKGIAYFFSIEDGSFESYLENISKHVDVDATKNLVYAQRFFLPDKIKIKRFQLPLIKFSDAGRIWIDVFSDNNGMPGKRYFRTLSVDSSRVRFMQIDNPWIDFPTGKNTPALESGYYWLALRSSGNCIFKWYAQDGNVFGEADDTRFMNVRLKNPSWNNLANFDMNFRLYGRVLSNEK